MMHAMRELRGFSILFLVLLCQLCSLGLDLVLQGLPESKEEDHLQPNEERGGEHGLR